ncbi:MarR family winged helix-turn-helix transcriptional regulator [Georgenia sunbinii]|uniref:MarR family winged helix-turn-helix transcriptional regulator n=1 Tax=Georgenia sunbinii TaxID=3117728 RepID=UPI002F26C9FE
MAEGEPRAGSAPEAAAAPGFELALLLVGGFRSLVDELHRRLAAEEHPDLRPAHGFAMQAVGVAGATATEVGARLGVSKQAAGKTIDGLVRMGYVERRGDPHDGRRKLVVLTERGEDCLRRSARIFDELRDEWAAVLGRSRLEALHRDLRKMASTTSSIDVPGWLSD